MKCQWDNLLQVLPPKLRADVDKLGRESMEELRLRRGRPAEMVFSGGKSLLREISTEEDLNYVLNAASGFSPWAAGSITQGYLTIPGGHRIGLCGEWVEQNGQVSAIRAVSGMCIRVARAFPGIADKAPLSGSLLILGPPGAGKTTLLRDLIRKRSEMGSAISVIDERGELFPSGGVFDPGPRTDVFTGCRKDVGVDMALKTMGPSCIAVDEITSSSDCQALISAGWCGVELLATAHAANCEDLNHRNIYQSIVKSGLFAKALVLKKDKSWKLERVVSWGSN